MCQMKFSEMKYSRPDMEALAAATAHTLEALKAAPDAAGQIDAYDAYEKQQKTASTMQQLAYIRHTINTKDEFYKKYPQDQYPLISKQYEDLLTYMKGTYGIDLESIAKGPQE